MGKQPEPLRERLLAQFEPDREKLATYRKEVQAMLERNEQTLHLQKRIAKSMGIGACFFLVGIGLITLGGLIADKPFLVGPAPFWVIVVCFILLGASFEILKYFIERSRVEVLKEVKGLQLPRLELQEQLQQREDSAADTTAVARRHVRQAAERQSHGPAHAGGGGKPK